MKTTRLLYSLQIILEITGDPKYIDTRRYFIGEAVTNGEIELVYVNTEDQLADGMTKALQPALHRKCLDNYLSHFIFS